MDNKIPKIIECDFINIYNEKVSGKLVPLSLKTQNELSDEIENLRKKQQEKLDENKNNLKSRFKAEINDIEDAKEQYLKLLASLKLSEIGKEVNDEEVKKFITRYSKQYTDNKSYEDLIDDISALSVDITNRTKLIEYTVTLTVYYSLRKNDNLRERVFDKIDDILSEIDMSTLYSIFSNYSKENDLKEEEIKNSQSPASL